MTSRLKNLPGAARSRGALGCACAMVTAPEQGSDSWAQVHTLQGTSAVPGSTRGQQDQSCSSHRLSLALVALVRARGLFRKLAHHAQLKCPLSVGTESEIWYCSGDGEPLGHLNHPIYVFLTVLSSASKPYLRTTRAPARLGAWICPSWRLFR